MKPKSQKSVTGAAVVDVTRKIKDFNRLLLFVRAGGRCEFDGCNKYLLEHHLTLSEGNFAEMAHIVAFSEDGPRGKCGRPVDINNVSNLMALCPQCHKLIDDNPEKLSKATLEGYKQAHERRIKHVSGLGPEQKTSIMIVKSRIGSQTVSIPYDQLLEAVTPRYPYSKEGLVIDLSQLNVDSAGFLKAACDTLTAELQVFFSASGEFKKTDHISLFALCPIPILVFLGGQLSNKVPTDLYQRHRDTEKWSWKTESKPVSYSFTCLQDGTDNHSVAILLSLSGSIDRKALPAEIDGRFYIYEITLQDQVPAPTFLNSRADLERFRTTYQYALSSIAAKHPGLPKLHLFPAVPAPVAVLCGRELLPKVHPELLVYDNDKRKGGFIYQLSIN